MWIPLGMAVTSQATWEWGSFSKRASKMASAIWSHTLSGCPAVTLSEVKKVVILPLLPFSSHSCSSTTRWRWGSSSLRKPRIYRTGDPPFPEIAGLWNERRELSHFPAAFPDSPAWGRDADGDRARAADRETP